MRAYKEDSPINTINRIRGILFRIGLLPIEKIWFNPKSGLFSVRLEIPTELGQFGTNGKGKDFYYALASAYAEFIERIQNGFITGANGLCRIFLKKIKEQVGFYYYPDEKLLSKDDFLSLPKDYLLDIYGKEINEKQMQSTNDYFTRLKDNGQDGVISVPFYDCMNRQVVYFPYNMTFVLSGSNGMASGNTPQEAIFQALCELAERYAARTVFFDLMTPPSIPDSYLEKYPIEFQIIKNIRECGFEVVIKDFSCGYKLPAIGVILIDRKNKKYRLNIGSDTSFNHALGRALSEIYQGIENDDFLIEMMVNIPTDYPDYFNTESAENIQKREREIRQFIVDGTGVFPPTLFSDVESYSFSPLVFQPKDTYYEEVQYLIKLFSQLGHSVYLRDVSYLGFPTFYAYIPKVSRWGRKSIEEKPTIDALIRNIEVDKIEDYFFPTQTLLKDKKRIQQLLDVLAPNRSVLFTGFTMEKMLKLSFRSCEWSVMPVNFFISLLCFANNEYQSANDYLRVFMDETSMQNNKYYTMVSSLLLAYEKELPIDVMKKQFPRDLLDTFSSVEKAFASLSFPTCPDCDLCPLYKDCLTQANYKNTLTIAREMKENNLIKQTHFSFFID